MKFKETQSRSIMKSATFRVLIVISDLIVIYILTKKIGVTIAVTVLTNIASTILYFSHERLWDNINWGRQRVK